jgi:ribosome maturation factor RimP
MKPRDKKIKKSAPGDGEKRPDGKEEVIIPRVYELIDPICEAEGMELVCVEYQREPQGRILRLYIDRPEGVNLDDCTAISRQAGDLLDVAIESIGPYNLEVSSPGPNRPLGRERDFEKFCGNRVWIKISHPVNGKKQFKGTLHRVSEGVVELTLNNETVSVPFKNIIRARLLND